MIGRPTWVQVFGMVFSLLCLIGAGAFALVATIRDSEDAWAVAGGALVLAVLTGLWVVGGFPES